MFLNHSPVFNGASLAAERCADEEPLTRVGIVGAGVTFVLDLLQGFFGGSIEFELEDINILRGLDDAVGAALGELLLGIDRPSAGEG